MDLSYLPSVGEGVNIYSSTFRCEKENINKGLNARDLSVSGGQCGSKSGQRMAEKKLKIIMNR